MPTDRDSPVTNLAQILPMRPWRQALFTSYALSLTFFDCYVLPKLREVGCTEIWVIVDIVGYTRSLMERRSSGVGQDYHLVPVSLPNGVFHPKCTYLSSEAGDILGIGSGNLTFGGYGRNLEVLETFDQQDDPEIFGQFASFLRALDAREDLSVPDKAWIDLFASQAEGTNANLRRGPSKVDTQLVHTATITVKEQLESVIAPTDSGSRMTVLSPYFGESANGVLELARSLKCTEIAVCLPPYPDELTRFPFDLARDWDIATTAVRTRPKDPKRPLHAKWIDVKTSSDRYTLTGSVNATYTALTTTNNIEVGILRHSRDDRFILECKPAKPPKEHQPDNDLAEEEGQEKLAVYATISGDAEISGRLIGRADLEGQWQGSLTSTATQRTEFQALCDGTGSFKAAIDPSLGLQYLPSLQIWLARGNTRARGWLHLSDLLGFKGQGRITASMLSRFMRKEATSEDEIALLDYLALSAHSHLQAFAARPNEITGKTSSNVGVEDSGVSVPLNALAPSSTAPLQPLAAKGHQLSAEDAINAFFARLRRIWLSTQLDTTNGNETRDVLNQAEDNDPDAEGVENRATERFVGALENFDQQMRNYLSSPESPNEGRSSVCVIWFEVECYMRLHRLSDRSAALEFIEVWFYFVTEHVRRHDNSAALDQYICVVAALILGLTSSGDANQSLAAELHEQLERYVEGDVDDDWLRNNISEPPALLMDRLAGSDLKDPLSTQINSILNTATLRQELVKIYELIQNGEQLPRMSPVFETAIGQDFRNSLESLDYNGQVKTVGNDVESCGHCHLTLTPSQLTNLRRQRLAKCEKSCGRYTMRLEP